MLLLRLGLTALLIVAAAVGAHQVWVTYFEAPWTRDGRVRADTVTTASYVAGKVVEIRVRDNQEVQAGDVLLVIDPAGYQIALAQAEASLQAAEADAGISALQAGRVDRLAAERSPGLSQENRDNADLQARAAAAQVALSTARRDSARLDLDRTVIRASVAGFVTNLTVSPGDYATPGMPLVAVVDRDSFRVDAYFMETKMPRVRLGSAARIRLMSGGAELKGRVAGIARAIIDQQNPTKASLLQAPDPTFEWVRLAQRIPVRVDIDSIPDGFSIVAGMTATVTVEEVIKEAEHQEGGGRSSITADRLAPPGPQR